MTRILMIALVLVSLVGCGAELRNTALKADSMATKTTNQIMDSYHGIAAMDAVSVAKLRIAQGENQETVLNDLANDFEAMRYLDIKYEKTKRLRDITRIYIMTRESYLELLKKELEAAQSATAKP